MVRAKGKTLDGQDILIVGLSFENLAMLRDAPCCAYIKIVGEEMDLPHDIVIFAGRDEEEITRALERATLLPLRSKPAPRPH